MGSEVLLGMGRDQDHVRFRQTGVSGETLGEIEAALLSKADVQEDDLRLELIDLLQRLGAGGSDADHVDPLTLEKSARRLEKGGAVVHDQAAQRHPFRIATHLP